MKLNYLLFLLVILFSSTAQSQSFDTPLAYLQFISEEQETITKSMWNYTKAVAHSRNEKNVERKRSSVIQSIERVKKKVSNATAFENDPYKQNVLENLELNENIMKMDYAKIIDMKAVSQQSYDSMESYILAQQMADKKMAEAQQEYEDQFIDYAKRHNIEITENETELGKKMQISNKVFKYYNAMYLPFFKANITESYIFEALDANDISSLQQHAISLGAIVNEERELIKNIPLYKDDTSLLDATNAAFDFYQMEAEVKIPELIDFLLLQEEVQNISQIIEKTPKRKRTKEQIDGYNEKVNELNKKVAEFNRMNTQLNKERTKVLNGLNNANDQFLARHIPKE
tara:strand:+ start:74558 stop:75589 length:1032 start_codon:yes stop_codon:yes gene_type:complete